MTKLMRGRKSLPYDRTLGVDEHERLVLDESVAPVEVPGVGHLMANQYHASVTQDGERVDPSMPKPQLLAKRMSDEPTVRFRHRAYPSAASGGNP